MRRGTLLRAGAAAGAATVAGCLGGPDQPIFTESFEHGLGDSDGGVTIGRDVELAEFGWTVQVSGTGAVSGDRSLRLWNEEDYDDGTTSRIPRLAGTEG